MCWNTDCVSNPMALYVFQSDFILARDSWKLRPDPLVVRIDVNSVLAL